MDVKMLDHWKKMNFDVSVHFILTSLTEMGENLVPELNSQLKSTSTWTVVDYFPF